MIYFIEVPQGIHNEGRAEVFVLGRRPAEQYKVVLLLLIGKLQGGQKVSYQTTVTNTFSTQTGTKTNKQESKMHHVP